MLALPQGMLGREACVYVRASSAMLGRAGLMVRQVGPARNRCACASLSRAASHTSGAYPFVLSRRAVRCRGRAVRFCAKVNRRSRRISGFSPHGHDVAKSPFAKLVESNFQVLGRGSVQFDGAPSVPVDRARIVPRFTIHRAVGTCSTSSPRRQRLETLRAPATPKSAWLECRRPGVPPLRLAKRLARPLATSA